MVSKKDFISLKTGWLREDVKRASDRLKQWEEEQKNFKCPISYEGCTRFCGNYGCGG